jgi:hypothetical protein
MLEWEEYPKAKYPSEQYRAVGGSDAGKFDYRIFYDKDGETSPEGSPWILVIREASDDGVYVHRFREFYGTDGEAKGTAERWEGPPSQKG